VCVSRIKILEKYEILLEKECFIKRWQCQIKPLELLNVPHRWGMRAVNFYAEMPGQIKGQRFPLSRRIVDNNPRQRHLAHGWDDYGSGIDGL